MSQARPALPLACPCRSSPAAPAILHGLARREAPQTAAPQWEPRKPLAGTRKARRSLVSSGASGEIGLYCLARPGPPMSFSPSDQSRKRILYKKGPSAQPGPVATEYTNGRRCGLPPPGIPRGPGYGFGPAASPVLNPAAPVLLPSGWISSRAQCATTGNAGRRWLSPSLRSRRSIAISACRSSLEDLRMCSPIC